MAPVFWQLATLFDNCRGFFTNKLLNYAKRTQFPGCSNEHN